METTNAPEQDDPPPAYDEHLSVDDMENIYEAMLLLNGVRVEREFENTVLSSAKSAAKVISFHKASFRLLTPSPQTVDVFAWIGREMDAKK
jgi:hypothetical protein